MAANTIDADSPRHATLWRDKGKAYTTAELGV